MVSREAPSPSAEEFRRVVTESRLGRDLNTSLAAMADRVGGDDFTWVAQAIEINREVGGDLAEVLDNVSSTIRERARVRRQVRTVSAEGRTSALVLVALPFVMALLLAIVNPEYLSELGHGAGLVMLLVGGVLLVIGSLWTRRLVKVKF
jgi:tight adherence protein B